MASLRSQVIKRSMVAAFKAWRHHDLTPDSSIDDIDIASIRREIETLVAFSPDPRGATILEVRGPRVDGDWVLCDDADLDRVVVWMHGGAHCLCSPRTHRRLAADLSKESGARVFLPDFRLAPEHPFPAALEDVSATWDWLIDERGVDPAKVVFGGDSSGGGLAVSLLVDLRDRGRPLPAATVLFSPWVDLTASSAAWDGDDPMIPVELAHLPAKAYAADLDPNDPKVSPINADLRGLPPMLIHVGTDEALIDDCKEFVRRLRDADVEADLGIWEGMWHVFQAFPGFPERRRALREAGGYIRRRTGALVGVH